MDLQEHPKLERWYLAQSSRPKISNHESLVYNICKVVLINDSKKVRLWVDSFMEWLNSTPTAQEDYLHIHNILLDLDFNVDDFNTEIAETAIRHNQGKLLFQAIQKIADKTHLVGFRFLSAWLALNFGDLEACCDECEKVDRPFSSVYTLHGQALVELKRVEEALEVLTTAVKLSPNEILAWFQIAKANYALHHNKECYDALKTCLRLAPQSQEVALFLGILAREEGNEDWIDEAWTLLSRHISPLGKNTSAITTMLDLANRRELKADYKFIVDKVDWKKIEHSQPFYTSLSQSLKILGEKGWYDVANVLLEKLTLDDVKPA